MMLRAILVAGVLAAGGYASAQSDPAKERSSLMRGMLQEAYSPLRQIVRSERAYDTAAVAKAYAVMEAGLKQASSLWPPNTPSDPKGRFGSSPKVWESRADFDQKMREAQTLITGTRAQATSGIEGLKASWPQIDQACSACHETYRVRQQ